MLGGRRSVVVLNLAGRSARVEIEALGAADHRSVLGARPSGTALDLEPFEFAVLAR